MKGEILEKARGLLLPQHSSIFIFLPLTLFLIREIFIKACQRPGRLWRRAATLPQKVTQSDCDHILHVKTISECKEAGGHG